MLNERFGGSLFVCWQCDNLQIIDFEESLQFLKKRQR